MAIKKKNAVKEITQEEYAKLAKKHLDIFRDEAKARYDKAKRHYEKQSDTTQDSIDRMVEVLVRIAHKQMWIKTGGNRIVATLPEEAVYHNMFYMACEILKDMALFDIRVGEYTFPTDTCASCGNEIVTKRAKKKVKK